MTKKATVDLEEIQLSHGNHTKREDGVCAMELVAWLAGEPHTDHPKCASPVLTGFLINWNDSLDDEGRQKLKPYLPRIIGTVGTPEQEQASAFELLERMIKVTELVDAA